MFKKLVSIVVVLAALMAFASPAFAQGTPATYYVDTAYTGTETGSSTQPFNTLEEAISAAQACPSQAEAAEQAARGMTSAAAHRGNPTLERYCAGSNGTCKSADLYCGGYRITSLPGCLNCSTSLP